MPPKTRKPKTRKPKRKSDAETMTETAKEIHTMRKQPRKLMAWLKGLRKHKKIVFAIGIIFVGIYLGLSKPRREAFVRMASASDDIATHAVKTATGGTMLARNALDSVSTIGNKTSTALDLMHKAVDDMKVIPRGFISLFVKDAQRKANSTSIDGILKEFAAFAPNEPKLLDPDFRLANTYATREEFLKNFIPHVKNIKFTLNAAKNTYGYRGEKGWKAYKDKADVKVAQAFSKWMREIQH